MLRQIVVSSALIALSAGQAFAQSSTVTVNGSIAPACSALSPITKSLGDISGTTPGSLNASKVNVSAGALGTVTCNGAGTTISVDANPLTGPALPALAADNGFTNVINYTATVNKVSGAYSSAVSGTSLASNTTSAAATTGVAVGLLSGDFTVDITAASAAGLLIASGAGGYTGTITVSLTAG